MLYNEPKEYDIIISWRDVRLLAKITLKTLSCWPPHVHMQCCCLSYKFHTDDEISRATHADYCQVNNSTNDGVASHVTQQPPIGCRPEKNNSNEYVRNTWRHIVIQLVKGIIWISGMPWHGTGLKTYCNKVRPPTAHWHFQENHAFRTDTTVVHHLTRLGLASRIHQHSNIKRFERSEQSPDGVMVKMSC